MTAEREKISESREKFKESKLVLQNILDADKIGRFKFTPKEITTLLYMIEFLTANIKELENL
jgi:hypothetical protein